MNATMLAELKKRQSGESVEESKNPSRLSSAAICAAPGFTPCRPSSAHVSAAPLDDVDADAPAADDVVDGSGRVRSVDEPYPERMGAGVRTLARQQKLQGHEALCCFQVSRRWRRRRRSGRRLDISRPALGRR